MALLLVLLLAANVLPSGKTQPILQGHEVASEITRACTVDDLVPPHGEDIADSWDKESLVSPPFDCTCTTLKASYFCPNLGNVGYPKWQSRQVSSGACQPTGMKKLKHEPFPPGFKVLFFGNSHVRQVVESIICTFASTIQTRWLTLEGATNETLSTQDVVGYVDEGKPCRGCAYLSRVSRMLVENGCVPREQEEEACSCDTNDSAFEFENGAVLHYHFAHREENKSIEDALKVQGTELSDYDAVIANPGNPPRMKAPAVLRAAGRLKEAGVPFFWLSTYGGDGDLLHWLREEQEEFWDSGARFVPVHHMVESLTYLTRGSVEHDEVNHHFCLPGPPTEIGILLLKIAWALYGANGSNTGDGEDGSGDDDDSRN